GEDDQVDRRSVAEARADADVVLRGLRDQDRLLLERGLSDESLADLELVRNVLALLVAVRGDQAELEVVTLAVRRLHHEERAVLRPDERRQLGADQERDRLELAFALQLAGETRHA